MRITSISWFGLLLLALFAIIGSNGTALLDAMAMLLFGYVIIVVRTGKNQPLARGELSPFRQLLHVEWEGLKAVKFGGVLMLLAAAILLLPLSLRSVATITLGVLAIELAALLVLECALRVRLLGNIAMVVALLAWFWGVHLCSTVFVAFLSAAENIYAPEDSLTALFDPWPNAVLVLFGCVAALWTLLRVHPKRDGQLSKPRLWLFA